MVLCLHVLYVFILCFPFPSVGCQAKTLMFAQLNPDIESYSKTISTLKFAERVSGVELGAGRRNKEGKEVRDLMEQVLALFLLKHVCLDILVFNIYFA